MREARARIGFILFRFFICFLFSFVCVSEYVCVSLSTNPVYVIVITCLAYFWWLCTNCQAYVYLFVGHLIHIMLILFIYNWNSLSAYSSFHLHVEFIRMGPNIQDWGGQMYKSKTLLLKNPY